MNMDNVRLATVAEIAKLSRMRRAVVNVNSLPRMLLIPLVISPLPFTAAPAFYTDLVPSSLIRRSSRNLGRLITGTDEAHLQATLHLSRRNIVSLDVVRRSVRPQRCLLHHLHYMPIGIALLRCDCFTKPRIMNVT